MPNKGESDEIVVIDLLKKLKVDEAKELFGDTIIIKNPTVKSKEKADVIVTTKTTIYQISIKSFNGRPPAVLNHTHRGAWAFQSHLSHHLKELDKLITRLISIRKENGKEDNAVSNLNLDIPMSVMLMSVVKYFMFEGTGSKLSKVPANTILEYSDNMKVICCFTNSQKLLYVAKILNKLIISLRNKGMPKNINEVHEAWIYDDPKSGKKKGSLHIRLQ